MVLDVAPTDDVVVSVTAGAGVTVAPMSLTFTTSNWETVQTVRVTGAADDDDADEEVTISHAVEAGSAAEYVEATVDAVTVTVTDDDGPGVTLDPPTSTELKMREGGTSTYALVLDWRPEGNVVIDITAGPSPDDLTISPRSLTFTTGTWSAAQTVTVQAGEDADEVDEAEVTITHTIREAATSDEYDMVAVPDVLVNVDDNDDVGLTVDPEVLTIKVGGTGEFTVKLDKQPTGSVTISMSPRPEVTVDPTSLEFTTSDWNVARTVTVTAGSTAGDTNVQALGATSSAATEYRGQQAFVTVTVTTEQVPGVTVTPTTFRVGEGTSESYTVVLDTAPSGNVVVTVAAGTGATVDRNELRFTPSNWSTAQTVRVTADQDGDAADETVTISHAVRTGSATEYVGVSVAGVTVTVLDDDAALVVVSSLTVPEGGTAEYTVVLGAEPTGNVTVSVTGDAGTDVSVSGAPLTFSDADWGTAQTVTVTADEDDDAVRDQVTLMHSAEGGGYGDATRDLVVTVADNDASLEISLSMLTVDEDSTVPYTVNLAARPAGDVRVTISGEAGTDVSLSGAPLTFSTSDWGTAQTVTMTVAGDDDVTDDTVTLRHSAGGGHYDSVTADLVVTVADDDAVLVIDAPSPFRVTEGATATYTVALAAVPAGNVTVAVSVPAGSDVTLGGVPLMFSIGDWSTAKTVTVTGGVDADVTDDEVTLTHSATGGGYNDAPTAELAVTVVDDDARLVIDAPSPLRVTEGMSATYTVKLRAVPTGNVTVAVSAPAGSGVTLGGVPLTFTPETWGTAQTVTVTGDDDADAANDEVTLSHSATGGGYDGATTAELAVTVDDDDAALTVAPTTLSIPEGDTARYTVVLAAEPAGDVSVAVTGHDGSDVTVSGAPLTFSPETWGTAQTVTVRARVDIDAVHDSVTLTHTATGGHYDNAMTVTVAVTVQDDSAKLVIDPPTRLSVPEGGTATYTVALEALPAGDVTVAITGHESSDVTVSGAPLVFTTDDWGTAQTVTVTGGVDADVTDDSVTLRHTATGGHYGGTAANLPVTVDDEDAALVIDAPSPFSVDEGGTAEYTVALDALPAGDVTVSVTVEAGSDVSVIGAPLTFTTDDWETAQTVTVTADTDADVTDDTVTLAHSATDGGYDGVSADLVVTVDDDDAKLVISPPALTVDEGTIPTYTVRLAALPTDEVTVTVTGHEETDLTLSGVPLTFTTDDWSTAQTVTVTAGHDADIADDKETLAHSAEGGGYDDVSADLKFTVTDDDPALTIDAPSRPLSVPEGATATYTVRLAALPTGEVTVAIAAEDDTDVSVIGTPLTFTTETWETAQTVTVTAGHDTDITNDTATLTHTATDGGYKNAYAELEVTVVDDDAVVVARAVFVEPTVLSVAVGGSNTYEVSLATQPTADVTVAPGSSDTAAATVSGTLTFSADDWATAQTVTVSGVAAGPVTVSHTVTGGDYGANNVAAPDVSVTVAVRAVTVEPTTLSVAVDGSNTYEVSLATQPTANVTVTASSSATTTATVSGALTFSADDWATAQTVTVSGVAAGDVTISHTVTGGDYGTNSVTAPPVAVTVAVRAVTVEPTTLNVTTGASNTYEVSLATQPTENVTVTPGSSDTAAATVSDALTFTTGTWATAQTITVSGVAAGDVTISHTVTGGDYGANSVTAPDVAVTVAARAVVVEPTTLNVTTGATNTYTVVLATQPTENVTIAPSSSATTTATVSGTLTFTTESWATAQTVTVSGVAAGDVTISHTVTGGDYGANSVAAPDVGVTVTARAVTVEPMVLSVAVDGSNTYEVSLATQPTANVTVTPSSSATTTATVSGALTFTTESWATAQTVTVSGVAAGDVTMSHTVVGGDYGANSVTAPPVAVTVAVRAVAVEPTTLNVTVGATNTYEVSLATQPTADVTVTPGSSDTAVATVSAALTFSADDWATAQTITVSGVAAGDVTISHTVAGGDYGSVMAPDVGVTVTAQGVTVEPTTLSVAEGASNTYEVSLATQPTADVTVTPGSSDTAVATVSAALTFSADDWATAQTITVSGVAAGDVTISHTVAGGDYGSVMAPNVAVTVAARAVTVEPTTLNVAVDGSNTYEVSLATQPTADVTVTASSSATTTATVSGPLTFTTDDWATAQTVTVSGVAAGPVTMSHSVVGGDYGANSVPAPNVAVTVAVRAVTVEPTTLNVTVGASNTYDGGVGDPADRERDRHGGEFRHGGGDGVGHELTFTTDDWATAQTVTVSGAAAGDVTISHTVAGGDYGTNTVAAPDVGVTVTAQGVVVEPTMLSVAEGASNTYEVSLATRPTANVTVTPGSSDTALATVSGALTFSADDWATAQTITVSGVAAGARDDLPHRVRRRLRRCRGAGRGGHRRGPRRDRRADDVERRRRRVEHL